MISVHDFQAFVHLKELQSQEICDIYMYSSLTKGNKNLKIYFIHLEKDLQHFNCTFIAEILCCWRVKQRWLKSAV